MNTSATVMKVPAWIWLVVFACCVFLALLMDAPEPEQTQPDVVTKIFADPLLVAKTGNTFRFVPYAQRGNIKPLWVIVCVSEAKPTVEWRLGWGDGRLNLGLYRQWVRWQFGIASERCDDDYKNLKIGPAALAHEDMESLVPKVIEELDRRSPGEHKGARFKKLLDSGLEETSFMCIQNGMIILAWLALLPAIAAVVAMVNEQRSVIGNEGRPS